MDGARAWRQLKTGWVIVGSLPSTNGLTTTAGQGCLLVVSPEGKLAEVLTGAYLDGPWEATVKDDGSTATLFVANTLVGLEHSATASASQGDVVRLSLRQTATTAPKVTGVQVVAGKQLGEYYAIENTGQDPPGSGDLFGIAIDQAGTGVLFVKDDEDTLALLR
jgi:hypothetical protein